MQSTNTSSPLKPSTASASRPIGPYRTIITNYAPFATTNQRNSQIDNDTLIKLMKSNREVPKKYSKSSDKIIIKDIKQEQQEDIGSGLFRTGFGKLYNAQGILWYEGQLFNDQMHGNGMMFNHDVNSYFTKYIGNFSLDKDVELELSITKMVLCMLATLKVIVEMEWDNQQKEWGKHNGIWLKGKLISKI